MQFVMILLFDSQLVAINEWLSLLHCVLKFHNQIVTNIFFPLTNLISHHSVFHKEKQSIPLLDNVINHLPASPVLLAPPVRTD